MTAQSTYEGHIEPVVWKKKTKKKTTTKKKQKKKQTNNSDLELINYYLFLQNILD